MTPYIFDGKDFSLEKETGLKRKVDKLLKKGIYPKLVSIIVGDNPASTMYLNLKQKAAKRVGVEVVIKKFGSDIRTSELVHEIERLNKDHSVHGIMVQMPLPDNFSKKDREEIINAIDSKKDVDGLRRDSEYLHPTSKAVLEILKYALNIVRLPYKVRPLKVCVVGATGMVGSPLIKELGIKNNELWGEWLELIKCNSKTKNLKPITLSCDVIISCAGVPNLIKEDMVKKDSILIDVGAPIGDIDPKAYNRVGFVSPVPGGVGPVTISCLLENLVKSVNFGISK